MLCILLADVEMLQHKFEHLNGDELLFLTEGPLKKDSMLGEAEAVKVVLDNLVAVRVFA